MGRLYHPEIYDSSRPVPSYWEAGAPAPSSEDAPLSSDESCDVAVIGGGYTGLSTALHLARDHGIEVRLLEAGHLGWGASGRNGGFCCFPAAKMSISQMVKGYGLEEAQRFFAAQVEACELVRQLGEDEAMDFDLVGRGNLEVAHGPASRRRPKELRRGPRQALRHRDPADEPGGLLRGGPRKSRAVRRPLGGAGLRPPPLEVCPGLGRCRPAPWRPASTPTVPSPPGSPTRGADIC